MPLCGVEPASYRLSDLNRISERVIGAAMEVHREMGPGLIECIYEWCLMDELRTRGVHAINQVQRPITYKGRILGNELKIDVIVEDFLILELKVLEHVLPVHKAQLLSYLRLTGKPLGLLFNFHVPVMRNGVYRIINDRVKIVDDL